MFKSTLNRVIIEYDGCKEIFEPVMVENCMKPGTYKTYPVDMEISNGSIKIKTLHGQKIFDNAILTEEEFEITKPGKTGCDGNCGQCQKCS